MVVHSVDANLNEEETIKLAVDSSFNKNVPTSQCPSDKPFAYQGGNRCCGLKIDTEAASKDVNYLVKKFLTDNCNKTGMKKEVEV